MTVPMPPPAAPARAYLVVTVDIRTAKVIHAGVYSSPARHLSVADLFAHRHLDAYSHEAPDYDQASKELESHVHRDPYWQWLVPYLGRRGRHGA